MIIIFVAIIEEFCSIIKLFLLWECDSMTNFEVNKWDIMAVKCACTTCHGNGLVLL